jgi:phenylpyruvate tautomerase
MPLLTIKTNTKINHADDFALTASKTVSEILGKPESYIMIDVMPEQTLIFAGNNEPAALLTLKSLGLPESSTADFSSTLCELINSQLGINKNRIYIEFSNPERHMWGWNGATF